eukprot:1131563-Rhodomonas_salina.4
MQLGMCYAMCGTEVGYAATGLHLVSSNHTACKPGMLLRLCSYRYCVFPIYSPTRMILLYATMYAPTLMILVYATMYASYVYAPKVRCYALAPLVRFSYAYAQRYQETAY